MGPCHLFAAANLGLIESGVKDEQIGGGNLISHRPWHVLIVF